METTQKPNTERGDVRSIACSAFLSWANKAGYLTCTSDIQIALEEAWSAGRAEKEREVTSLRHTITLLEKEMVGMEMELDCCCNAEELRSVRDENAKLREQLERALIALEKIASYQGLFGEDDPQSVASDILPNVCDDLSRNAGGRGANTEGVK